MQLEEFCLKLVTLQLSIPDKALALLWFHDEKTPDARMTAGELSRIIHHTGLGSPHSTKLAESLKSSGLVLQNGSGFSLKTLSRGKIRGWLESILVPTQPEVNQDLGYLPKQVWTKTRGYLEKVCEQLNGCFQFGFYDGASVLVRRILETLIIEAYEKLKRENEIKDSSGNFFMLSGLINTATSPTGITLGRDAKKALADVKELGDRSAHNRRYNAVKADLEKVQSGVRVVVDELINIAVLRHT
jgi:hypothetical protein